MSILIFGDSFIGPFTLLANSGMHRIKFAGATMKGIIRPDNPNNRTIIRTLTGQKSIKCVIFNFGQVDLQFSFYYDIIIKKEKCAIFSTIQKYIEFISNLNCKNATKIVFAIYPPTILDDEILDVLEHYGIVKPQDYEWMDKSTLNLLSSYKFRYALYKKCNVLLKKYCKMYNIIFIEFDKELIGKNDKLKSQFINKQKRSIHLMWEPLMPVIISKLKKYIPEPKYKRGSTDRFRRYVRNQLP